MQKILGECNHCRIIASCPHCMKLQEEYYSKIKLIDPDWEDIEDHKHHLRPLKCWHSLKFKRITKNQKAEIETYYQKARGLLHTFPFESDLQRKIWELHSNGIPKTEIEKEVASKDINPFGYKRSTITLIIKLIAQSIK